MVEPILEVTLANLPVDGINTGGMNLDQNLVRRRLRLGCVFVTSHLSSEPETVPSTWLTSFPMVCR